MEDGVGCELDGARVHAADDRAVLDMQFGAGRREDAQAEPGDADYVEAMSYGMAPNGGCGVGVDRLAMVLLGKDAIRDVILFPTLRSRD